MARAEATSDVVQGLLAQVRELKVDRERLRLELREIRAKAGGTDPRLRALETEVRRQREELADARQERDSLLTGVAEALEQMARA